jgi:hypothetical protein
MHLTLPLNFGERQCDRLLLARLASPTCGKQAILWMAFMVWRDFGIARDDRRQVPLDPQARAHCDAVVILEQYCGWEGAAGHFVESAISSGFFLLTPVDELAADLVLVDFFPANRSEARQISNSKLGGISKGMNIARRDAAAAAAEQLGLFEKSDSPVLKAYTKNEIKNALFLVHQVCRILRRQAPVANEWREALASKAITVLNAHTEAELESAFRWMSANRDSQEIPPRLDFILDGFAKFVTNGRRDFA